MKNAVTMKRLVYSLVGILLVWGARQVSMPLCYTVVGRKALSMNDMMNRAWALHGT